MDLIRKFLPWLSLGKGSNKLHLSLKLLTRSLSYLWHHSLILFHIRAPLIKTSPHALTFLRAWAESLKEKDLVSSTSTDLIGKSIHCPNPRFHRMGTSSIVGEDSFLLLWQGVLFPVECSQHVWPILSRCHENLSLFNCDDKNVHRCGQISVGRKHCSNCKQKT